MKAILRNIILFLLIFLTISLSNCSSTTNESRFFSVNKQGTELQINNENLKKFVTSIISYKEKSNYHNSDHLDNPFSPIPWYSFTMRDSDFVHINLFYEQIKSNIFSNFLIQGEYYIDFEKLNVPIGLYFLQFIGEKDTIVKQVLIGKEFNSSNK